MSEMDKSFCSFNNNLHKVPVFLGKIPAGTCGFNLVCSCEFVLKSNSGLEWEFIYLFICITLITAYSYVEDVATPVAPAGC